MNYCKEECKHQNPSFIEVSGLSCQVSGQVSSGVVALWNIDCEAMKYHWPLLRSLGKRSLYLQGCELIGFVGGVRQNQTEK